MMDVSLPDRFCTCNGTSLRYRDAGSGPPVILVHGWALDLEMWDAQVERLRGSFRLICYDRRGFGLSRGRPSIDGDCADLRSLCRHLQLGRLALVGMSQGARAVVKFATAAPDSVSCVVLDGPPDLLADQADEAAVPEPYRVLARTEGMDAFRRAWINHPLVRLRTRDPSAHRHLRSILERYPGHDLADPALLPSAAAGSSWVGSLAAPTLIITGDHDLAERIEAANVLARRLPRAERATIPDAGHLPNLDNPLAYTEVLRAFLDRHASAPT